MLLSFGSPRVAHEEAPDGAAAAITATASITFAAATTTESVGGCS